MANDWTRLLQEASRRGGPEAMRAFYSNRGKMQGAGAMLLLVGSITLAVKARDSFAKAKDPQPAAPEPTPPADPGDTAPGGTPEDEERVGAEGA
jgi:hypothetical protein